LIVKNWSLNSFFLVVYSQAIVVLAVESKNIGLSTRFYYHMNANPFLSLHFGSFPSPATA